MDKSRVAEDEKGGGTAKGRDGFFGELSLAQVVATSLAAVTSVFFASKIGITGSLIGTALASIVATVTAQLYKKFFSQSAKKLRSVVTHHDGEDARGPAGADPDGPVHLGRHSIVRGDDADDDSTRLGQCIDPADDVTQMIPTVDLDEVSATRVLDNGPAGKTTVLEPGATPGSTYSRTVALNRTDPAAPGHPDKASSRRCGARSTGYSTIAGSPTGSGGNRSPIRTQQVAVIVAVIAALVSVALFAYIIDLATGGNGIGTKTQPILTSSVDDETAQTTGADSTSGDDTGQGATESQTTDSTGASDSTAIGTTATGSTTSDASSNPTSTSSSSGSTTGTGSSTTDSTDSTGSTDMSNVGTGTSSSSSSEADQSTGQTTSSGAGQTTTDSSTTTGTASETGTGTR